MIIYIVCMSKVEIVRKILFVKLDYVCSVKRNFLFIFEENERFKNENK